MSVKGPELKDLVVKKLEAAAEEIIALFERVFAEYQDEVLRSKLLQQPRVVLYKEDAVAVAIDNGSEPIKEEAPEEEERLPSVTVKSEENINEDPAEENGQEPIEEQCDGEEPGLSVDSHLDNNKQHGGSSDTNNSSDWESTDKRATKKNRHKLKAGRSKKSTTDHATGYERPHRCAECSRTFQSEKNLNRHLQLHAGQGAITCYVCSKVFRLKSMYRKHLRMHSGEKPYSCSVCERRFNSRGQLKEHARSHTGEKPYSCSGCGMEFRLRTTRDRHFKKVHNVQKLYTCSVCEKSYVEKYYYVIHMRIHTGERPFSCSVCNKGYREKKMLKKHMSVHEANAEG